MNKIKCSFCEREFSRLQSKVYHENRCYNNPNKKDQWNKGLTKEDERVKKYSDSMRATKNKQEWKDESKKRIHLKWGGKHWTQHQEWMDDKKKKYLEKNGVEWPIQKAEIYEKMSKACYKTHQYVFPSGKIGTYQGYEKIAINFLLEQYDEKNIIIDIKEMPKIFYEQNKTWHRYYPDIFIKHKKLFIEVKSLYTINENKEINLLKHNSTKELGFKHQVWIIDPKQQNKIIIEDNLNEYYKRF